MVNEVFGSFRFISYDLRRKLANIPEILNGAIGKYSETFKKFLSIISEEQLHAVELERIIAGYRYMLSMDHFDEAEFNSRVYPCFVNVIFLPMMDVNRSCHFEALIHLLENGEIDFSGPEPRNTFILESLVASKVPEYWNLFCLHAKSFPPLHQNNHFFAKFANFSTKMLASLDKDT